MTVPGEAPKGVFTRAVTEHKRRPKIFLNYKS